MSKNTVSVNAEGMSRFDLSAIFGATWTAYRLARPAVFAAGDETGKRSFVRPLFVRLLRTAWAEAKKTEARVRATRETEAIALLFIDAQRKVRFAIAASLSPEARSVRLSAVRDEITLVDYAPWGVRANERRAELRAELDALEEADRSAALIGSPIVAYVEVAPTTWDVVKGGKNIGQVRKHGYRSDAFSPKGELIRPDCKTRAHAALWLVRADTNSIAA